VCVCLSVVLEIWRRALTQIGTATAETGRCAVHIGTAETGASDLWQACRVTGCLCVAVVQFKGWAWPAGTAETEMILTLFSQSFSPPLIPTPTQLHTLSLAT
jgi:hypothetical protein